MVNLTINGKSVSVPEGSTILEAARSAGIDIPVLCYYKDIHKYGACRICVVEVEGAPRLQASCIVPVNEGMVVHTNSDRVRKARKAMYELIMSDHNRDCLTCSRNQHCELQALGQKLGVTECRYEGERLGEGLDISPAFTRDLSKCILCRRCVTMCNQIQETDVLNAQNRGFSTKIGPAAGELIGNVDCSQGGQCTVVCPVAQRSQQARHRPDGSRRPRRYRRRIRSGSGLLRNRQARRRPAPHGL